MNARTAKAVVATAGKIAISIARIVAITAAIRFTGDAIAKTIIRRKEARAHAKA